MPEAIRGRPYGLYKPTEEELDSVAEEFGLHPLAVEDTVKAHQRPKLERYGATLFVVLRAARYIDESEEVDFVEIHVFVGDDFVITVRHGEASALGGVRAPSSTPSWIAWWTVIFRWSRG
ncbi:MAG: CorA family divalent cation transporter [Rubrobacteraceae bacterium]